MSDEITEMPDAALGESRAVVIDTEHIRFLEQLGFAFMRLGEERTASKLLGIVLAWRVSPVVEQAPPTNVIELKGYTRRVEI